MSELAEHLEYQEVVGRIAELAEELVGHPDPEVSERVQELLDWVDAFHRDGLGQLVEMIRAWRGEIFLEAVSADSVTGTLLRVYGLGEDDEAEREAEGAITAALDEIRPYAESHGGTIALDGFADGVVHVKLLGSCDGCPSSAATLQHGVEEALRRHWPHFRRLELVEDAPPDPPPAAPAPQPVLLQIRGHERG